MAKKAAEKRHDFDIPIGDWSDDGHGKCEYFQASAAKPFKAVCLAYATARAKFKALGFSPEDLCSEYEDNEVPEETVELLKEHGFEIHPDDFYAEEFAKLVVWFLNQGDPDLDAMLTPAKKSRPMLRNWDYCKAMKTSTAGEDNLGGFGYGLFGS